MDLEKAIELLRKAYEQAKYIPYVKRPLAWALFQVWRKVYQMRDGDE